MGADPLRKKFDDKFGWIFAVLFFVFLLIVWLKKGSDLKEHGKCTAGIIDHLGASYGGYSACYVYQVNGVKFESYSPISRRDQYLVVKGKKFVVKYQEDDPSNSAIFLTVPLSNSKKLGSKVKSDCCDTLTEVYSKI